MAANSKIKCSNCWQSISLDMASCPFCGFVFGEGKVGAASLRMQRGLAPIEPEHPVVVSRLKSGALTAGGFALCLAGLDLLAASIPFIGLLAFGAVAFASPFSWGWALIAGRDAPWPIDRAYLPWAMAAPFPIVGLVVGYVWPFGIRSWAQVLNAVAMRFALSLGALLLFGFGAFMFTLSK